MEGSATWTTLLTQLQAPKIPTLSQGYDKATTQIMEGGGGEEDGTPLLTNPPDSETPTLQQGGSNEDTWSIDEGGDPNPPDEMEIPSGLFMGDTKNGFNKLSRLAMMWTVCHLWPGGTHFDFNLCRHSVQLLIRRLGEVDSYNLLSCEGDIQGEPSPWYFID